MTLVKTYILTFLTCSSLSGWSFFSSTQEKAADQIQPLIQFTLMLDPADDGKDPSREIQGVLEKTLTMQCAEELKRTLESKGMPIRVILTRFPGEVLDQLHISSFANKLNIDCYVSLHFFEQPGKGGSLSIYHALYNKDTDYIEKKATDLALVPYDQAYRIHSKKTERYASHFFDQCKKEQNHYNFKCHAPKGIPFKPLSNIVAPAFALEIGIAKKETAKEVIPLIAQSLISLIEIK